MNGTILPRAWRRIGLCLVLVAASCTGVSVHSEVAPELAPLRAMGYRIAVMPFVVSAPADGFLSEALAPVGELLALEGGRGAPMRDQLAQVLRRDVVTWLQQSEFAVQDPWQTDTQLTHAGLGAAAANDPARAGELARVLGVDAILFGDLQRWNRSYYVVQSTAEVALQIEVVDGGSGERLFRTARSETIGSGVTGGPTGYVSIATEPLAGLRGSHLRNLTRSVARHVVADLNGGDLGNTPGPMTPRLAVVGLAQQHEGPFRLGERVDVVAVGSPDCDVRFDVGRLRVRVPMVQTERHPDPRGERATYVGHYIVQPGDLAGPLRLSATIQRGMAQRGVASQYAWEGTLSLAGNAAR